MLLYLAFGFAAALLEAVPFIGIFFTVSNRVGACMWAFGEYFLSSLFILSFFLELLFAARVTVCLPGRKNSTC